MPMRSSTLPSFCGALAGLLLGGCTVYSGLQTGAAGTEPKPRVVLVSDFSFTSDVVAIDRGYTARLERKVGTYPTHERRQRTTERVNDEIVATIVASLRRVLALKRSRAGKMPSLWIGVPSSCRAACAPASRSRPRTKTASGSGQGADTWPRPLTRRYFPREASASC